MSGCGSGILDVHHLSASEYQNQIPSLALPPELQVPVSSRPWLSRSCLQPSLPTPCSWCGTPPPLPTPTPLGALLSQGQLRVLLRPAVSMPACSPVFFSCTASNLSASLLALSSKYLQNLTTSRHLHHSQPFWPPASLTGVLMIAPNFHLDYCLLRGLPASSCVSKACLAQQPE